MNAGDTQVSIDNPTFVVAGNAIGAVGVGTTGLETYKLVGVGNGAYIFSEQFSWDYEDDIKSISEQIIERLTALGYETSNAYPVAQTWSTDTYLTDVNDVVLIS